MKPFTLRDFVRESNRIEGIPRVSRIDMEAHEHLLSLDVMTLPAIEGFALRVTRGEGRLRSEPGMDVRVGRHVPPKGGPDVPRLLGEWLRWPSTAQWPTPYLAHIAFEKLHPFMDGNGRTGRALWLWQVGGMEKAPLGFLHHFYYLTLENHQR